MNRKPITSAPRVRPRTPPPGSVSVRTAKATLSALLKRVAAGDEVLITSDGKPQARLVPATRTALRPVFPGDSGASSADPWRGGPDATQIISEDRDARGW